MLKMTPRLKKIVIRIAVIIVITLTIITRLFAYFVLGEPFFGERLNSLFFKAELPVFLQSSELEILRKTIHPIGGIGINQGTNDYSFLDRDYIVDAEIIGLGEATHGTKEFFELKSKIFQYLVNHQGVKLFGIEANFAACYDINKYILTGEGNPKDALSKNGYWVWQTQEILDLIKWMKAYNIGKSREQKIQFYGYDMQDATSAIVWLTNYLTENISDFDTTLLPDKFDENTNQLRELSSREIESLQISNLERVKILNNYLVANESRLLKIDTLDYRFARQAVETTRQKLFFFMEKDFSKAYSFRDSSMTQNIKWIVENNNHQKIMLWAHNGHIGKGTFSDDYTTGNWMGTHLDRLYGKKYYSIGFSFSEGGFVSQSPPTTNLFYLLMSFVKSMFKDEPWLVSVNYVEPHPKSYLTKAFSQLEESCFFLDFKDLSDKKSLINFVNQEYEHFEAGAIYINEKSALWTTNLYELFDGIIFVNKTLPAENFKIGQYGN
jgi:erythromycin esterase